MGNPLLGTRRAAHAEHEPRLSLGGEGHEASVRVHGLGPLGEPLDAPARGVLLLDHGLLRGLHDAIPLRVRLGLQVRQDLLVVLDLVVHVHKPAAYPHEPVREEHRPPGLVLAALLPLEHGLLQAQPVGLYFLHELGKPARVLHQVDGLDAIRKQQLKVRLQLGVRAPALRDALHQHGRGSWRLQLQQPPHAHVQESVHGLVHVELRDQDDVPDHDDVDPEDVAAVAQARHPHPAQLVDLIVAHDQMQRRENAEEGHADEEEEPHAKVRKLYQQHLVHPDADAQLVHRHLQGGGRPAQRVLLRNEGRRVEAALVHGPRVVLVELGVQAPEEGDGDDADQKRGAIGGEGEAKNIEVPALVGFQHKSLLPCAGARRQCRRGTGRGGGDEPWRHLLKLVPEPLCQRLALKAAAFSLGALGIA
mmetsp:Transcript_11334/g.36046  ORF Transcript_11334/g.36046 Transcript_11334/m.36046 type:complete len:419 (+) Transcript_11334:1839-3095(+)